MNIIINQNGVKRSIEGAFAICLNRQDAKRIVELIQHELESNRHIFGWIPIYDRPNAGMIPNTEPLPWS